MTVATQQELDLARFDSMSRTEMIAHVLGTQRGTQVALSPECLEQLPMGHLRIVVLLASLFQAVRSLGKGSKCPAGSGSNGQGFKRDRPMRLSRVISQSRR